MIDIVRDYVAISTGAAQATTARVVGIGRAGASRVASLGSVDREALSTPFESVSARSAADRGRQAMSGLLNTDVDQVIGRLGLAKKSELNALLGQIQRIERRLGDVRGER